MTPYELQEKVFTRLAYHSTMLKKEMPDNPACWGWKGFSQSDEDGIIRECLRRIHTLAPSRKTKTFFEAACGAGIENNSHQLLLDGYKGIWVEGNAEFTATIEKELT